MNQPSHYITIAGKRYPYDNGNNEQHYAALATMKAANIDRATYESSEPTPLETEHNKFFPLILFENTAYVVGEPVELLPSRFAEDARPDEPTRGMFVGWDHDGSDWLAQRIKDGRDLRMVIQYDDGRQLSWPRRRVRRLSANDAGTGGV